MNEINILFLGGAKRVSLAEHFKVASKKLGRGASIFSYELDEKVPISCVGHVILGKRWTAEDVVDDLKACIGRFGINVVLPFVDPAIRVCATLRRECPNAFIPVSDINLCEIMFDKVLSAEWFAANGIVQPRFFKNQEEIEYPVILKPRTGSASKGIVVCRSKEDLPSGDMARYLCSAYIEDRTEYSVDCYVNREGRITSIVPRVRLETAGGEVVRSVTIRDEEIISTSRKILASGLFRGPITIQFIRDNSNGSLLVMEINPRFGGGVVTSIGAGSSIVDMVLRESMGETIVPVTNWKDGVFMTRYFKEVVFYADNH